MPSNIFYQGFDLDDLYEYPRQGTPAAPRSFLVNSVDISDRYTSLASTSVADGNIASRIPLTGVLSSAGVDLSETFAGNPSQYSISSLASPESSTPRTVTSTSTFTHQFTLAFPSAAALEEFFHFGGRVLISAENAGSFPAGSEDKSLQDAWAGMESVTVYDMGTYCTGLLGTVNNPNVGGSNIGTTPVTLYTLPVAGTYGSNTYTIAVVANAAAGSATTLTFTITLSLTRSGSVNDTYDGTRASIIQQRNYSGLVSPTQSPPTYSQITFNW